MLSIRKYKVRNDDGCAHTHAAPMYGVKVTVVVSDNQTLNGVSTKLQSFERIHNANDDSVVNTLNNMSNERAYANQITHKKSNNDRI